MISKIIEVIYNVSYSVYKKYENIVEYHTKAIDVMFSVHRNNLKEINFFE